MNGCQLRFFFEMHLFYEHLGYPNDFLLLQLGPLWPLDFFFDLDQMFLFGNMYFSRDMSRLGLLRMFGFVLFYFGIQYAFISHGMGTRAWGIWRDMEGLWME